MMQLFPTHYRTKGLLAVLTGLAGFLIASNNGLINVYRILLPGNTMPNGSYPYPANFWDVNSVLESGSICFIVLGLIGFFLASEPDEFYYNVRLESIQFAMFTQLAVSLGSFAYFYFMPGYQLVNTFECILALGFGSSLVAYVLRYYYTIYFQPDLN